MNAEPQKQEAPKAKISPKSRKWLKRGLNILLIIVVVMGVRAWQQRNIVKGPAAPLSGLMLDGKPYVLPAKPAQPVLVQFWATWCPSCRAERSTIEALARENPNVITVTLWSGNNQAVQQYVHDNAIGFPVINDPDTQIGDRWGVNAVPASFIIGTDGKIRFVEFGFTTEIGLRLRLWLAGL
jgi:thiol-disulfide isomerase/thioredoxin